MSSLFALTEQYRSLLALADSEVEIDEETMRNTLEGLGGELQIKAQNVARFVLNQDAMATAIEDASAAMKIRAERLRKRNANMKQYLLMCMEAAGINRIESPEIVVAIRKNPASVVVFDESAIPPELMVQKPAPPPSPDKAAIKELLKADKVVPGCRLEQGQRLEVKA